MKQEDVQKGLKTIRDWTEIILNDCRTAERDLNEIMDYLNSIIEESGNYGTENVKKGTD